MCIRDRYTVDVVDSNGCTATTTVVIDRVSDCVTGGVGNAIDLELIKRASVSTPRPGDTVVFQLTVFNNSENDATGVTVQDVIPSGFTIVPGSIDNSGAVTQPNVATWSLLNIEAFDVIRLSIAVTVNESGDYTCLLYTSPSPRDATLSRMPSSA